jgi:hypothetical protein
MDLKLDLIKLLIPSKNLGKLKLGEEDELCVQFAQHLRVLTLEKNFPFLWFHVPNQIASLHPVFGLKQTWMGRIAGIPDYVFLGKSHSFVMEFKSVKGKMSPAQKIVQKWCEYLGISYHIIRCLKEAQNIINEEMKKI